MKIRNLRYTKLNKTEKEIVKQHYINCCSDSKTLYGDSFKRYPTVNKFWKEHREADTDYGRYNKWRTLESAQKFIKDNYTKRQIEKYNKNRKKYLKE